ncbi:hypothetical protein NFC81_03740 [Salinispirillum sp. LH 10-3-1]|uniref:Hyalin n=1 Tax=Salinispirillum sp. LH 10-3-1 TaxID=2952525 RepID=A0AB38YHN9_9GAMM
MTFKLKSTLFIISAALILQGCNDSGNSASNAPDENESAPSQGILFVANVPGYGSEFWVSVDSTANHLYPIDLFAGNGSGVSTNVRPVALTSDVYLFTGKENNDFGEELYRTDGTLAGTRMVKNIYASGNGSVPNDLTQLEEGKVVFTARSTGGDTKRSLWVTDGTESGTIPLLEDSDPKFLTPLGNGKAVFNGLFIPDPETGFPAQGLMVTDGTVAGTKVIYSDRTSPQGLTSLNDGRAVFYFQDAKNGEWGPWITDGTSEGTYRVKAIRDDYNREGVNAQFTKISDDLILFRAQTPDEGNELWATDGTETGTYMVKDIRPGNESSSPFRITAIGDGNAIFWANDGTHGQEPWVSDGTADGTVLLKDIRSGASSSSSGNQQMFFALEDHVYFAADDGNSGRELWVTDGTTMNTQLVKDLNPGPGDGGRLNNHAPVPRFALPDGRLLFSGNDRTGIGYALWVTDGTDEGTELFYNLEAQSTASGSVSFPGNIFLPITIEP